MTGQTNNDVKRPARRLPQTRTAFITVMAGRTAGQRGICPVHDEQYPVAGDHELLGELNELGRELGPFTGGILTKTVTVTEQLAFGYRLIRLAGRIHARVGQQPFVDRPPSFDGDAL